MPETGQHRRERKAREQEMFSELAFASPKEVFEVDRLRRAEGRRPTSLTVAVEETLAKSRRPGGVEVRPQESFFQGLAPTIRGGEPRERMERAFDRGRTPTALTGRERGQQLLSQIPGAEESAVARIERAVEAGQLDPERLRAQTLDVPLKLLREVDRFRGAVQGLIAGGPRGAVEGFKEPFEQNPRDLVRFVPEIDLNRATEVVLSMPPGTLPDLGLDAQDIATFVAGLVTDPLTYLTAGTITAVREAAVSGGRRAFKEVVEAGAEQAIREVMGPIDRSVVPRIGNRNLLEGAMPEFRPRIAGAAEKPLALKVGDRVIDANGMNAGVVVKIDADSVRVRYDQRMIHGRATSLRNEATVPIEDILSPSARGDDPAFDAFRAGSDPDPIRVIKGDEPEGVLREIAATKTPGEKPSQTLLRQHEGALNTAQLEARLVVDGGARKLRALDIGERRGATLVPRDNEIAELDELFAALHGEGAPPERLTEVFEELRALTNWEEAARLDFDPEMATVADYFYRGWKPPAELFTGEALRGRVGARPAFKKVRKNATYQEMRDAGFEPLFWNPYEQWRVSRMQGVRYREQIELVESMKELGLAVPDRGGVAVEGWRTPNIGPAFEGKPFVATDAAGDTAPLFTRRWVVEGKLADSLENIYGAPLRTGTRSQQIGAFIDAATFLPKRAKLFGSFFQQMDFLTRSGVGAWTGMVDNLLAGKPIAAVQSLARWPQSVTDILRANMSPDFRANLRQTLASTDAILPDRPGVHFRGLTEAGLSTIDVTILPRNIDQVVREIAEEAGITGTVKQLGRKFGDVEGAMRSGLFEGVYPAAIMSDIRNNIAPMAARQFPKLSDEALNGVIARVANIKYSVIPASQSIVQERLLRETLRRIMFSFGETEGLLRQATQAVKGPFAPLWRKHWLGAYLFLLGTANAIHFASTGQALPAARYSPISLDGFGPLPFGYNRDFASPDIPLTGRSGAQLTLDVVGQLDTVFRILDPVSFLAARESVSVRAVANQLSGTDYFGRDIDLVGPEGIVSRTQQLIMDVAAPIGIGQGGLEIARALSSKVAGIFPEGEGRVGIAGNILQSVGLNVRGETTPALLDRKSQERFDRPFAELEPFEKRELEQDEELAEELQLRTETGAIRGSEAAERGLLTDERREVARSKQEALDGQLQSNDITIQQWKDQRTVNTAELRGELSIIFRDLPEKEPETPLQVWGALIDEHTDETGAVDWDAVDTELSKLSIEDQAFIDRNTGLNDTEFVGFRRDVARSLEPTGFFEIRDRVWGRLSERFPETEGFEDERAFRVSFRKRVLERLEERGITGGGALVLAERIYDDLDVVKAWRKVANDVEEAWVKSNVRLADLAIQAGYLGNLRKEELQAVLTQ